MHNCWSRYTNEEEKVDVKKLWPISAFCNILLGGVWNETMCSRSWRNRKHWWFCIWYHFWNTVFLNRNHCLESYLCFRERRKSMQEQLELPMSHTVKCDHCGQQTPLPIFVCKHTGTITGQYMFCSDQCSIDYYVKREGL